MIDYDCSSHKRSKRRAELDLLVPAGRRWNKQDCGVMLSRVVLAGSGTGYGALTGVCTKTLLRRRKPVGK